MNNTYGLKKEHFLSFSLLFVVLIAFSSVINNGFVNFDDFYYVLQNDHVRAGLTGNGIFWAFTTFHAANWHPITWLSHMLDCQLFGLNPVGHHLVSLFFHVANTLLVFLILREGTGKLWESFAVAVLFGLHPLRVESVAWISERKDVLSGFFGLLSMLFYIRYAQRPSWRGYGAVLTTLVLGLMSKPMLVTLPFVYLLLDCWPLRRIHLDPSAWPLKKILLEKLPMLMLAAVACMITYYAQSTGGAVWKMEVFPISWRIIGGIVAYQIYLGKIFLPVNLAILYPHLGYSITFAQSMAAALILILITLVGIWQIRERPYLIIGWLWFAGMLLPVSGIIQVGLQSMADRYTYLPSIGIFIALVWFISSIIPNKKRDAALMAFLILSVICLLSLTTYHQTQYWRDTATLFRHTLEVTKNNYLAQNMLGNELTNKEQFKEARIHLDEALRIVPSYSEAYVNLGQCLEKQGFKLEALDQYRKAIKLKPSNALGHIQLGNVLTELGHKQEAITHYRMAAQFVDDNSWSHDLLGIKFYYAGDTGEALIQFQRALKLAPLNADTYNNLGMLYLHAGNLGKARKSFSRALELNPNLFATYNNMGLVLMKMGDLKNAAHYLMVALDMNPHYEKARKNFNQLIKLLSQRSKKEQKKPPD